MLAKTPAEVAISKLQNKTFKVLERSSRLQMFFKIGVLQNFPIFTGRHCWSFLLISPWLRLQLGCLPVNITKFLRKETNKNGICFLLDFKLKVFLAQVCYCFMFVKTKNKNQNFVFYIHTC